MARKARILIVEDDYVARRNLCHILEKTGEYLIDTAGGGAEAFELLAIHRYDLVLTDLRMEKVDGMQVLTEVKQTRPEAEVIMLTAYATVESAIEAMKQGAFHYIAKPFKIDEVRAQVARALENTMLKEELEELKQDLRAKEGFDFIIGKSPPINELLRTVERIAPTDSNVLIVGETGTGKELFARALHNASPRAEKRFVAFNCAAFNEELLVSELFGHEKGAFTGATNTKVGLFEVADGGTIFLDEVGDMPPAMQAKLLRVIQEKVVTKVGGTEPIPVDVRLVAATNQDLQALVKEGRFRSDLYFRLNVVALLVPPLRKRMDDLPLLAQHFLQKYAEKQGKNISSVSSEVMAVLKAYEFPGNVRELENLIERAVSLSDGLELLAGDLPDEIRKKAAPALPGKDGRMPTLLEREVEYINWVLQQTEGNKTRAAEILGIDRVSLWRKINKYGLQEQ